MPTVTVNDTPIRYEESGGDGPAVLFSPGFMMDHTMFDAQVATPNMSHPAQVNDALTTFLESL